MVTQDEVQKWRGVFEVDDWGFSGAVETDPGNEQRTDTAIKQIESAVRRVIEGQIEAKAELLINAASTGIAEVLEYTHVSPEIRDQEGLWGISVEFGINFEHEIEVPLEEFLAKAQESMNDDNDDRAQEQRRKSAERLRRLADQLERGDFPPPTN